MSVLIKGMEMPKTAWYCSMKIDPDTRRCNYTGKEFEETLSLLIDRRCADCPLVEVLTPHGRLGDLDKLWDRMSKYTDNDGAKMPFGYEDFMIHRDSACELVEDAPTIIEAEGSENECPN